MAQVIGVRFREVGKVYYFDPLDNKFEKGDHVIVETVRGMECGEVALENSEVSDEEIVKPLKSVVRRATDADLKIVEENRKKEQENYTEKTVIITTLQKQMIAKPGSIFKILPIFTIEDIMITT